MEQAEIGSKKVVWLFALLKFLKAVECQLNLQILNPNTVATESVCTIHVLSGLDLAFKNVSLMMDEVTH